MDKAGFVYIMASARNGTLYIGVTSDLAARVWQHREGVADGFTKKYGCKLLVWYEAHGDIEAAIRREKQMKEWKRLWKLRVIEEKNPTGTTCSSPCFRVWTPAFAGVTVRGLAPRNEHSR